MDVAAKLGLIVDGSGMRQEVAMTTDQLRALANGGREAAAVMKEIQASMKTPQGDGPIPSDLPPRVNRLAEQMERMRRASEKKLDLDFSSSIRSLDPFQSKLQLVEAQGDRVAASLARMRQSAAGGLADQIRDLDPFQSKLEQISAQGDRVAQSMARMRAAGQEKADLGLAAQIAQLDPFQKNLTSIEHSAEGAHLGLGRLGNTVTDLGARLTGVHPVLGKTLEVLGNFAVGHGITLAVIAGITAIAFAYDKLTESTRKATEEQNKLASAAREAAMTRALGPGGEAANQATAVAGRISDLQQEIKERSSFLESLRRGSAQEFNLNPSDRAEQVGNLRRELEGYQVVLKGLMDEVNSARVQKFAEAVTAPFDYATQRGQSVLGMYGDLEAAQRALNEDAKSGVTDTRNAALAGLQQVQAALDQIRLQRMGLAEGPSSVRGMPSGMLLGGVTTTVGNLSADIDSALAHVGKLTDFGDRIADLSAKLFDIKKEAATAPESFRTGIQGSIDEVERLIEALEMAQAVKAGQGEQYAALLRNTAIGPEQAEQRAIQTNAKQQRDYGIDLATREAALKLPDVFDAVREHSLRLGESMRQAMRDIKLGAEAWKRGNILEGAKTGAAGAIGGILSQYSPANLAAGLVGNLMETAIGGVKQMFSDLGGAIFGSSRDAEEAARRWRESAQSLKQSLESFSGDDLAAQLLANEHAAAQLRDQVESMYGGIDRVLTILGHASDHVSQSLAQIAEAEARNAARIQEEAERDARYAQEDLAVRLLRAQGRDEEATALANQQRRDREYQAALTKAMADGVITISEQAYLASLLQVQAAEKTAEAMGILHDAVRNAPTGFRPEDYGLGQNYFGGNRGDGSEPYTPPSAIPPGASGGGGGPTTQAPTGPTYIVFQVNIPEGGIAISGEESPQTLARKTLQGVVEYGAASVGGNVPISAILEVMRNAPIMTGGA